MWQGRKTFKNKLSMYFPKLLNSLHSVRLQVLTVVSKKVIVFWVVATCSLVKID
jgi:hypothetical protein